MPSLGHCVQTVVVLVCALACVLALPSIPSSASASNYDDDFHTLLSRDTNEISPEASEKLVREDGLGSLLLKNLRFRDLLRRQLQPIAWTRQHSSRPLRPMSTFTGTGRAAVDYYHGDDRDADKSSDKRGEVSVSELAQILNGLKTRNVNDDGVKLQSLRFGRK